MWTNLNNTEPNIYFYDLVEHHIDLSDIRFDIFNVMQSEYLEYINFGLDIIEPSNLPHVEYFRTVIGIGKTIEV